MLASDDGDAATSSAVAAAASDHQGGGGKERRRRARAHLSLPFSLRRLLPAGEAEQRGSPSSPPPSPPRVPYAVVASRPLGTRSWFVVLLLLLLLVLVSPVCGGSKRGHKCMPALSPPPPPRPPPSRTHSRPQRGGETERKERNNLPPSPHLFTGKNPSGRRLEKKKHSPILVKT